MSNKSDAPAQVEASRDVSDDYLLIWTSEVQEKPGSRRFMDPKWIQSQAEKIKTGGIVIRDNPANLFPEGIPRKLARTIAEKDKLRVVLLAGGEPLLPWEDLYEEDNALAYSYAEDATGYLQVVVHTTENGAPRWHAFFHLHNPDAEISLIDRHGRHWLYRPDGVLEELGAAERR